MAYGVLLQGGSFTSDGSDKVLVLRGDLDQMQVINFTQAGAQNDVGVKYEWFRGMPNDDGIYYYKSGASDSLSMDNLGVDGFTIQNSSLAQWGSPIAITSSSNSVQPSFLVASTAALATGDVVRIYGMTGQTNLNGLVFEIEVVDATHFRPRYALATAPGVVGAGGFYQVQQYATSDQPEASIIFNVSSAANAVVTVAQTHPYEVNDFVTFNFKGKAWGNYQKIDGQTAKVLAVTASTLTLDFDTTAIGALSYPLPAVPAYSFAQLVSGGSLRQNNTDPFDNTGYIGMKLAGGANAPGGANGDVMYWFTYKALTYVQE